MQPPTLNLNENPEQYSFQFVGYFVHASKYLASFAWYNNVTTNKME